MPLPFILCLFFLLLLSSLLVSSPFLSFPHLSSPHLSCYPASCPRPPSPFPPPPNPLILSVIKKRMNSFHQSLSQALILPLRARPRLIPPRYMHTPQSSHAVPRHNQLNAGKWTIIQRPLHSSNGSPPAIPPIRVSPKAPLPSPPRFPNAPHSTHVANYCHKTRKHTYCRVLSIHAAHAPLSSNARAAFLPLNMRSFPLPFPPLPQFPLQQWLEAVVQLEVEAVPRQAGWSLSHLAAPPSHPLLD